MHIRWQAARYARHLSVRESEYLPSLSSVMKFVNAGHTYAPADKRRDRIRVLGRSSFRTDSKAGNGTAQSSKPSRQLEESGLARQAKMPLQLRRELPGNAHRCRRCTAEDFVDSATCSRIEGTTCPSSHIENPSGGSILFRSRQAVAEAQNKKAPALRAAPASPRLQTIWSSASSSMKCTPIPTFDTTESKTKKLPWARTIRLQQVHHLFWLRCVFSILIG